MADKRTFEGKNLEEVLAAASNALGIDEPDLDYEILDQGRQGLLGIGAKNVRIRVMPPLKPISNELISGAADLGRPNDQLQNPARDEARARRGSRRRKSGGRGAGAAGAAGAGSAAGGGSGGSKRRGGEQRARGGEGEGDGESGRGRSRRRRGRRGGRRRSEGRRGEGRSGGNENREPRPTPAPEVAEAIQETMGEMLGLCGLQLQAEARSVEGGVQLVLDGDDRRIAGTKNGELVGAFQFLLNRMARRRWPESGRIRVGLEGQESMRDEELIALAKTTAEEVTESGQSKRLKPMNAYERRLVHLTIRELGGVRSRSEGNGYLKRVLVYTED